MVKEITLLFTPKQEINKPNYITYIAQYLRIDKNRIRHFELLKKSLDARQKYVKFNMVFKLYIDEQAPESIETKTIPSKVREKDNCVHIIGCGPAGLFAALELIKSGIKPIIFERGKAVSERKTDIAKLHTRHLLNPDSNYCFGEGGAGTFSDGKLFTRSKKKGDISSVLRTFVEHGAPEEILYDTAPHIGTDVLPRVIKSMREKIIEFGGEIHFESKLTDIELKGNNLRAIVINNNRAIPVKYLILATGHSARDVYRLLYDKGIYLEAKPFAVGVRAEHPQELINSIQYHGSNYDKLLPAASYKLVEQINNRAVFSFCMCPGGIIVPSATEEEQIVVNGMSNSKHNSPFANAGIVVQVSPDDIKGFEAEGPLKLMAFQEALEHTCFIDKNAPQTAPAQRLVDFVEGRLSKDLPSNSYKPGLKSMMLEDLLPHVHTRWSEGTHSIEEMAEAARALGYEYIAICDHAEALHI
ncbi:MAG: FAD-dependent oxidoreductase, partial [Bacteroidales bacterium]|nr:FAD-dependent oxidoreductase [Bacteroidales bacterium]